MFKTIVVGVDGSEPSQRALKAACDIALKFDATLHLVHACQEERVTYVAGPVTGHHVAGTLTEPVDLHASAEELLAKAKKLVADHGCMDVKSHLSEGNPADALISCARDVRADLIVTGRRNTGAFTALLLGSTSKRISKTVECACMTVT